VRLLVVCWYFVLLRGCKLSHVGLAVLLMVF
jgi:hypothetical protein